MKRCTCVDYVFAFRRTGTKIDMTSGRDIELTDALPLYAPTCKAEPMDANDLLFLLYTSGSTGLIKTLYSYVHRV